MLGPETTIDRTSVELNFQHCQRLDVDVWVNFEFSRYRNEKFMSSEPVHKILSFEISIKKVAMQNRLHGTGTDKIRIFKGG